MLSVACDENLVLVSKDIGANKITKERFEQELAPSSLDW